MAVSDRIDLIQSILLEFKAQRGTADWPAFPIVLCDLSWKTGELYYRYRFFGKKFAFLAFYLPDDATRDEIREKLHPIFGPRDGKTPEAPQDE